MGTTSSSELDQEGKVPESYHERLLKSLLKDAEYGRNGATFRVKCSDGSMPLHRHVAAKGSSYLETFSEAPDIDCKTFSQCRRFLYLGTCSITNDNVSALLAAADFLLMEELKNECFQYLELYLDHTNYDSVMEIAEHYQNMHLRACALRFASVDDAKLEIVRKRQSITTDIQQSEKVIEYGSEQKRKSTRKLEQLEEQWTSLLQKDIDRAVSERKASRAGVNDDVPVSPFACSKQLGAVARLVYPSRIGQDFYQGVSKYDPNASKESASSKKLKKFRRLNRKLTYTLPRPPAPTKEQYEKLGILYTYADFDEALAACGPGDRLYLYRGKHDVNSWTCKHSQEIVALPGHKVRLEMTSYSSRGFFWTIEAGSLLVSGIDFKFKSDDDGGPNQSFLEFSSPEGELHVQDCTFDLGANAASALSARVSAILLKRGKMARIERNTFIGGGGSAIVILNDPLCFCARTELLSNTFVSTGQPSFATRTKTPGPSSAPLPENEIVPGPAAIEMWRLVRSLYVLKFTGERETVKNASLLLSGNRFSQNMRAPLAYRALSGAMKIFREIYSASNPKPRPTVKFYSDLAEATECLGGYELTVEAGNEFTDNGLEFNAKVPFWLQASSGGPPEKKRRLEDGSSDKRMSTSFPDGISLLHVKQVVEDEDGFPEGFSQSIPMRRWAFDSLVRLEYR